MVCPLRYVVAAVSILVALFVLLWSEYDRRKDLKNASSSETMVKLTPTETKSIGSTVTSFFTGQYLLDHFRRYRSSAMRAS